MPDEPDIVAQLLQKTREAQLAFVNGDSTPYEGLFERSDEATLTGPFGGATIRGWSAIQPLMKRAASLFEPPALASDVALLASTVMGDAVVLRLAESNRVRFKRPDAITAWDLRATLVFRRVGGDWRILHRHADNLFERRPLALR